MPHSVRGRTPSPSRERTGSTSSESIRSPTSIREGGHTQGPSGESSFQTRIDTSDRWRFGGPGTLPEWPLTMEDPLPSDVNDGLIDAVRDITNRHIESYNLQTFLIHAVRRRFSEGATPGPSDVTILVQGDLSTHYETALRMLDDLLTELTGIGWPGRVEVVHYRALNMQYFAARLSDSVQSQWPDIEKGIMESLDQHNLPWVMIFVINRGYWDEISVPTAVAKIKAPITDIAWREAVKSALGDVRDYLRNYQLDFILGNADGVWGPFSSSAESGRVPLSLGWPYTRDFNSMGMCVSREGVDGYGGTLGGYFVYQDPRAKIKRCIGITCHHVIRRSPFGCIDPNVDCTGGVNLGYPCQSPSNKHLAEIKKELSQAMYAIIPPQLPATIAAIEQRNKDDAIRLKSELDSYEKHIGVVLATSGCRSIPLQPNSISSPDLLMDWACIEISQKAHRIESHNYIGDVARILKANDHPAAAYWTCREYLVPRAVQFPGKNTVLFKRGYATGLTAGKLGGTTPAVWRISGIRGSQHHRGYVVSSDFGSKVALPSDSGSFCLNGNGELVGIIFAGDTSYGIGIMAPIELVVKDMERMLGLAENTIGV